MKVVFMGTPEFAVPTLQALIDHHQVAAVVTQPDRQRGRGKKVQFSPVKEKAAEYKIPVLQPEKARDEEFIQELETIAPDVIVVVAYGQILPERILNLPKYGCINVRSHDHEDGKRAGYRRYDRQSGGCAGSERNGRKPSR